MGTQTRESGLGLARPGRQVSFCSSHSTTTNIKILLAGGWTLVQPDVRIYVLVELRQPVPPRPEEGPRNRNGRGNGRSDRNR